MLVVLYLVSKLILYSLWCYFGMRVFRSPRLLPIANGSLLAADITHHAGRSYGTSSARQALGLGFFRLAIGFVLGAIAILAAGVLMSAAADPFDWSILAYALFLVPVRALEWWITGRVIGRTTGWAHLFLWVFGGVVLSCLADIPITFAVVDSFSGLC